MKSNEHYQPDLLFKIWWIRLRYRFLIVFLFFFFLSGPKSHSQFFNPEDSFIENAGDGTLFFIPASALATTLIVKDYEGSWQFTKSAALNVAVTGVAKVLINKERPFQGGDYAFPSGHTSIAFQSASFFHRRYGFKYSIPAYLLAGYTGFSRVHATRHDSWDVLAGAVVGIGSTWFFTTPRKEKNMELTFTSSDDHYLLGFKYVF